MAPPMGMPETPAEEAVEWSWRWTAGGRKPWRRRRSEALLSKQHIKNHSKIAHSNCLFTVTPFLSLVLSLSHFVSVPKRQQELEK